MALREVTGVWEMAAFLLLCGALALEKRRNDRALSSFRAIIHVNGIRGKTSTCRLLDAALRTRYRVFTKTTGTDARTINVSGLDAPLRRFGPANVLEQLRTIRRARREGAEILILECMAVRPELQRVCQQCIVKSTHSVITNVRLDHVLEMGQTEEEIAEALAAVTPRGGLLFTGEEPPRAVFPRRCAQLGSEHIHCPPDPAGRENQALARAVARSLGLTDAEIDAGFARVQRDFGTSRTYPMQNARGEAFLFYNLFSANDPASSLRLLSPYAGVQAQTAFLYNNRWDRPDRAMLFARHFFPSFPGATVYLLGDSKPLARRLFREASPTLTIVPVRRWQDAAARMEGALLVGVGNIKGGAHAMIERLETEEQAHA